MAWFICKQSPSLLFSSPAFPARLFWPPSIQPPPTPNPPFAFPHLCSNNDGGLVGLVLKTHPHSLSPSSKSTTSLLSILLFPPFPLFSYSWVVGWFCLPSPLSFPCWGLGGLQAISFPVHIWLLVGVVLVAGGARASCNWLPDFFDWTSGCQRQLVLLAFASCFSWCSAGSANCIACSCAGFSWILAVNLFKLGRLFPYWRLP